MEYSKPELTLIGGATDAIQSGFAKGPYHWDHMQGEPFLTSTSAYCSDEE